MWTRTHTRTRSEDIILQLLVSNHLILLTSLIICEFIPIIIALFVTFDLIQRPPALHRI